MGNNTAERNETLSELPSIEHTAKALFEAKLPTLTHEETQVSDIPLDTILRDIDIAKVQEQLSASFVFSDDVAEVLCRAFRTGKNVILWGDGGFGKSEMTEEVIKILGLTNQTSTLDFGDGTEEAALWGGIDIPALIAGDGIAYNTKQSWINSDFAIFEEFLDAPKPVTTSLKNTLSSGFLKKVIPPIKIQTRTVVGITNHDPEEYAREGATYDALIQRFPLRLKVTWPSFEAKDYLHLFEQKKLGSPELRLHMANILAEQAASGDISSPREAINSFTLFLDGISEDFPLSEDLQVELYPLRFSPQLKAVGESVKELYEAYEEQVTIKELIQELKKIDKDIEKIKNAEKAFKLNGLLHSYEEYSANLHSENSDVKKLQEDLKKAIKKTQKALLAKTADFDDVETNRKKIKIKKRSR